MWILYKTVNQHTRKTENKLATSYQVMQYTILNNECMNCLKPENKSSIDVSTNFHILIVYIKINFLRFWMFQNNFRGIFCPPNIHKKVPINAVTADVNVVTKRRY